MTGVAVHHQLDAWHVRILCVKLFHGAISGMLGVKVSVTGVSRYVFK